MKASDPIGISVETSALNSFNADHSARVGVTTTGTGWNVSVNGVGAWLNEQIGNTAYWIADDVPGTEEGWMELTATATPSGGGAPVVAKYEWEKPPLLRLKEYHLDEGFVGTGPNDYYVDDYERLDYVRKQGGSHTLHLWSDNGCTASWQWTADDVFTNYLKTCPDGYSSTNYFGYMPSPPNALDELSDVNMSETDGDYSWTFHRIMKQELELRAGGKPYPGRLDLVKFSVSASANDYEFTYEAPPPFYNEGSAAISNNLITVLGEAADVNGYVFAQVAPSSKQTVTPQAPGASKLVGLGVTQAKLQILRAGTDIAWQKTNVVIGETIALSAQLSTNIATTSSYFWLGMHGAVSNYVIADDQRTAQVFYLTNYSDFTNTTVTFHYPTPGLRHVLLMAEVAGKSMVAEAEFNVVAPTYSLQLCPSNTVGIHNYFLGAAYFHFGDGVTNHGINFFANPQAPLVETNFTIGFIQIGTSSSQRFFDTHREQRVYTSHPFLDSSPPGEFLFYPTTQRTNSTFGSFANALSAPDSPAQYIGDVPNLISRSDNFEMFLLYKPGKPGIWVPLVSLPWSWSGTAEWTGTQMILTSSNSAPTGCNSASGSGINAFPIWSEKWEPFVRTNWTSF